MRRLRLAVGVDDLAGLEGVDRVAAIGVGAEAAKSFERRVRQRALVLRIAEASLRIGLPDLQHAIWHRRTVAVEHPALDANAFARGIRRDKVVDERVVPVVFTVRGQTISEERTDGLRWCD